MIIKCKMCGGDLSIQEGNPVCECEFCGTQQTIPQADNEKMINLFNRANRLRMNSEFDKAAAVYASITAEFPEEAEAFWGLCLCKYGIEYVDDPKSGNKIPTCHRTLPETIMDDSDFEQACEYADPVAKRMYREEAKEIDRLQQSILSIVANEQPYDVFICYKETDENGDRTEDSVIAQDIYDSLTGKGLKVFFARITLEDKLGQEYEPYIYAALHSSKVMLAIGTKYEYYDAVWVKNEWARFLNMMKTDRTKTLIPCYKNLDAYDMPKEFKNLQAQDMNKLGWQQDLVRGVMKLCGKDTVTSESQTAIRTVAQENNNSVENLMKRIYLFLEDGDTDQAYTYINKILDEDAEFASAYVARVLIRNHLKKEKDLPNLRKSIDKDPDWVKALRFASPDQKAIYEGYANTINGNETFDQEQQRKSAEEFVNQEQYKKAIDAEQRRKYCYAIVIFNQLGNYRDSKEHLNSCIAIYRQELIQRACADDPKVKEAQARVSKLENDVHRINAEIAQTINNQEEAEKQNRDISGEIQKLTNEMNQLKGLFNGKRKREIEASIVSLRSSQNNAQVSIDELTKKTKALKERRKEAEEVLVIEKQALEATRAEVQDKSDAEWSEKAVIFTAQADLEAKLKPYKTIGNYVNFGTYPQTSEGKDQTSIEWLVLDYDETSKKALLLSRYGLDAQLYNTKKTDITWEKCSLRTWLNGEFLNKSFSLEEQSAILTTTVDNSSSQGYSEWKTNGGNNTQDKVFLLSYTEANKYLGVTSDNTNNLKSRVVPTDYAIVQGGKTNKYYLTEDGKAAGWWWLRSPGEYQDEPTVVSCDGALYSHCVDNLYSAVRPAFWLNPGI